MWRCSTCGGSDWSQVVSDGFGSTDNWGAIALIVFDNHLYCVTGNSETGVEVWRTDNGTDWGLWQQCPWVKLFCVRSGRPMPLGQECESCEFKNVKIQNEPTED